MTRSMLDGRAVTAGCALFLVVACGGKTNYTYQGFGSDDAGMGAHDEDGSSGSGSHTGAGGASSGAGGSYSGPGGGYNGSGGYYGSGGYGGPGGSYGSGGYYYGSGGMLVAGMAGYGAYGGAIPVTCGNGVVDPGEACDGPNLHGESCNSATLGSMPLGTLFCNGFCQFDTSGCYGSTPVDAGASYVCLAKGGNVGLEFFIYDTPCGSYNGGSYMGNCAEVVADAAFTSLLPLDVCPSGTLCVPNSKLSDPKSCFAPCQAIFGDGACVPSYVVEESPSFGPGIASLLGQATCATGETCMPCVNPLDSTITGACNY